jgi:hypothetical protein
MSGCLPGRESRSADSKVPCGRSARARPINPVVARAMPPATVRINERLFGMDSAPSIIVKAAIRYTVAAYLHRTELTARDIAIHA